jgi:hypothetical protein
MNVPRSSTVEYMLPAGTIPSWKVGAANVRPSSVHIVATAVRRVSDESGSNALS